MYVRNKARAARGNRKATTDASADSSWAQTFRASQSDSGDLIMLRIRPEETCLGTTKIDDTRENIVV